MIVGINFTGQTEDVVTLENLRVAGRFPKKRPLPGVRGGVTLKGIATTLDDARRMVKQANNGRRSIVMHEKRAGAAKLYGIYIR